jgi:hypothetical protein
MKIIPSFYAILSLALAASFFASDAYPQDAPQTTLQQPEIKINPASKARLKFESDMWDFGSIPRGSTVVHAFKFLNVGQDTLEITSVRPTCGCTTAPLSSDRIPPGGEGSIKAYFNSAKFNGRVTKQIYVDSNDPISPYLKVSFYAVINDPLQTILANPPEPDLDTINVGDPAKASVIITNNDSSRVELEVSEISMPSALNATLSRKTLEPLATADLTLELAPQAQPGNFKESVTIEAKGGHNSRVTIPLKAIIKQ